MTGLPEPDVVVDCLGRPCPVPVIELARALRNLADGTVVEVVSDDPAALTDVPAFCRLRGHEWLGSLGRDQGTGLRVRAAHHRQSTQDTREREHR